MKTYIVLSFLFLLTSCFNPKAPPEAQSGAVVNEKPKPVVQTYENEPKVRVQNYSQFIMTVAKLTKINSSNFSNLISELRASLPADNDIQAMTSFNLVAKTRLADAFCTKYVKDKSLVMSSDDDRDDLMAAFLDYNPDAADLVAEKAKFASLIRELDNIVDNTDQIFVNPNGETSAIAGCVVILTSSYITLLD